MYAVFFLFVASWLVAICHADTLETIDLGPSLSDLKALGISPVADRSSETGFQIPVSYAAAAEALEKMLPREAIDTIAASDGMQSDFLARDHLKYEPIGEWMYRNWMLGDARSAAGNELRSLGFASSGWMARALFERIYEKHAGRARSDIMNRLRRFSFSEQQDVLGPQSPPPAECAPANAHIKGTDIWLGQSDTWPYGRIISWVDCKDGTKKAYLWEREWFSPEPAIASALKDYR
jgi:hypothetical protein